jgi:hypothetical protein
VARIPAALACVALAGLALADTAEPPKPPLTKTEEREKFHPRALGMDAAARRAGFTRRQEMEKASLLSALRFRSVGPEIQGGRVVDVEVPAARPDALVVAFASGGLWRTDNRGGSWTPLLDASPR